MRKYRVKI